MARHFSFEEAISQLQNDGRTTAADPAPRAGTCRDVKPRDVSPVPFRVGRLILAGD